MRAVASGVRLGVRQQPGIGGDHQDRDTSGIGIRIELLQELPARLLPDGNVDDQGVGAQRFDLGEGVGGEVGGGDVVALLLEQLAHDVEERGRGVDGEDVLAPRRAAIRHRFLSPSLRAHLGREAYLHTALRQAGSPRSIGLRMRPEFCIDALHFSLVIEQSRGWT
jgi:hypothetical protein